MARNHTSLAWLGAVALALTIGGCQRYGDHGPANISAIKDAVTADEKKWNEQFKSKDLESLIGHYADDAYFVAPGVEPANGSTEIRHAYATGLSDPNFAISFSNDKIDVAASGDMAYARGRFTETSTDPKTNKPVTAKGSYITVYKKQADGSWKAAEDFAVADPGPATPVEPGKPVTRAKMTTF